MITDSLQRWNIFWFDSQVCEVLNETEEALRQINHVAHAVHISFILVWFLSDDKFHCISRDNLIFSSIGLNLECFQIPELN